MRPVEINQKLSEDILNICTMLLPNGKKEGNYYSAGSVGGEAGKSLKVYLSGQNKGYFTDYANPEVRGDMIDLWKETKCLSFNDALVEIKKYLGVKDRSNFNKYQNKEFVSPKKPKCKLITKESLVGSWYDNRLISKKTLDAYKIGIDGETVILPYLKNDKLMMLKYRDMQKEFDGEKKSTWCNKDPYYCLFGWQCIPDDVRSVVIVEGENDVLACYEQGIPALSVPFGGGGGGKQINWIENEYHDLERFDKIFLMLDMDGPGIEARNTIIESIGNHYCWVVELPEKDAGECHEKGLDLWSFINKAKTIDPEELKNSGEFRDEVWQEFYQPNHYAVGAKMPWASTFDKIRFRSAEVTIWSGFNGAGKSQVIGQIFADFIAQGERVCIASMEMKSRKLLKRMFRQISCSEKPEPEIFERTNSWLAAGLWIFNLKGTAKTKRILEVFKYARQRYGVRQFLIDSLSKCGIGEEDHDGQKMFIEECCDFADEFDSHIHIVAHSRKKEDESKVSGKMDVRGAAGITDMPDNGITVWRNKPKEAQIQKYKDSKMQVPGDLYDKADCILYCWKQRHDDWEGNIRLWFDVNSYQYRDCVELKLKRYL
jgi:twinkle protein